MFTTRQKFLWGLVLVLFMFTLSVWLAVFIEEAPQGKGYVTFAVLNVGQGDALFIEGPTGKQVLIDGGPDSSVLKELPGVMPLLDRSIDVVIATHPDADHVGGLVDVVKRYDVENFIEPGIEKHTATNDTLLALVTAKRIDHYTARRHMWIDLDGGAYLYVLYPDWDVSNMDVKKNNEGGIVARLVYGSTSVLLTADTGFEVENHLLSIDGVKGLASDILKVGHHGSRFSTSNTFVKAVDPDVAVISSGRNSYGHPTPTVLNTLAANEVKTYRTDVDGAVVFKLTKELVERI